jgi:ABC-2 type transport system permease protein
VRKLWIVAVNDLRIAGRSWQTWLLLLALPLLMVYLTGVGAQSVARGVPLFARVDVLDADGSDSSSTLIEALAGAHPSLVVCRVATDLSSDVCDLAGAGLTPQLAQQRLAEEVSVALVTIPEGFGAAVEAGKRVELGFRAGAAPAAAEIAYGALLTAVSDIAGPVVAARLSTEAAGALGLDVGPEAYAERLADVQASWGSSQRVRIQMETPPSDKRQVVGAQVLENGFKLSTPNMAVMFVMVCVLGMTQSLADERLLGLLRRIGTLPVSRAQFLGGKLLSTCLMASLQFVILLAFGGLLGAGLGGAIGALILLAGGYVLAVAALALALAALARSPQQATGLATLSFMVLAPLGGAWWPLFFVPTWLQELGHISPVAWCLDGLNALIFHQGTMLDVLPSVGALALFGALFFALAAKTFRY